MKKHLILLAITLSPSINATPPECDLHNFPGFWADAQDEVEILNKRLEQAERINSFASSTASAFRESLELCSSKHSSIWNESRGSGSAGVTSMMKCQAELICSRIRIIEEKW